MAFFKTYLLAFSRKHSLPFLFVGRSENNDLLKDTHYLSTESKITCVPPVCVCVNPAETCAGSPLHPPPPPCVHIQSDPPHDRPPAGLPARRLPSLPLPHGPAVPLCRLLHTGHRVWDLLRGGSLLSANKCHQLFYWYELLWIKRWNHDIWVSVRFSTCNDSFERDLYVLKRSTEIGITHFPLDKGLCVYACIHFNHLVNTYLKTEICTSTEVRMSCNYNVKSERLALHTLCYYCNCVPRARVYCVETFTVIR